jgi:hypothetical protein
MRTEFGCFGDFIHDIHDRLGVCVIIIRKLLRCNVLYVRVGFMFLQLKALSLFVCIYASVAA